MIPLWKQLYLFWTKRWMQEKREEDIEYAITTALHQLNWPKNWTVRNRYHFSKMNTFLAKGDMRQLAGIKPNEHNKRQHIFFFISKSIHGVWSLNNL